MIEAMWSLFLKLCEGLDEDYFDGELTLHPSGHGTFDLMEQRSHEQMTDDKYPAWAKKQRRQAEWFSLEDGLGMLQELVRLKG